MLGVPDGHDLPVVIGNRKGKDARGRGRGLRLAHHRPKTDPATGALDIEKTDQPARPSLRWRDVLELGALAHPLHQHVL